MGQTPTAQSLKSVNGQTLTFSVRAARNMFTQTDAQPSVIQVAECGCALIALSFMTTMGARAPGTSRSCKVFSASGDCCRRPLASLPVATARDRRHRCLTWWLLQLSTAALENFQTRMGRLAIRRVHALRHLVSGTWALRVEADCCLPPRHQFPRCRDVLEQRRPVAASRGCCLTRAISLFSAWPHLSRLIQLATSAEL